MKHALAALLLSSFAPAAPAAPQADGAAPDACWALPLDELSLEEGASLPVWPGTVSFARRGRYQAMWPWAFLEGPGEVRIEFLEVEDDRWWQPPADFRRATLAVRMPAAELGNEVHGVLVVPTSDWERMLRFPFTLPAGAASAEARAVFEEAEARRARRLLGRSIPGAAWFRHLLRRANASLSTPLPRLLETTWGPAPTDPDVEDTYLLMSGGRAVSENLQLDRLLPDAEAGEGTVELDSIRGIDVAEVAWGELLGETEPRLDPLLAAVPADQHALLFPSFDAFVRVLDEAEATGGPLCELVEPRSLDAGTRPFYERQLCLGLDAFARALGPLVVSGVCLTGSDPYLRGGSDVALLLETGNAAPLEGFVRSRHQDALAAGAEALGGEVLGRPWHGVASPGRRSSSYVARVRRGLVVANSLHQLERVVAASEGEAPALAASPEARFFRTRYPRGDADEAALLLVPDAAIRRWCGPRWRIGGARRLQAAAALAEVQARHAAEIVAGVAEERIVAPVGPVEGDGAGEGAGPDLGRVLVGPEGVRSERYGTLDFLTPIAELDLGKASAREAELYGRWRDGYQRNWSGFFDPIAARISVADDRLAVDLTVLPLIEGSSYAELVELAGDARIDPGDGDPHGSALVHFLLAIDRRSEPIREAGSFLGGMSERIGASPLDWLGSSLAVYVDRDPLWDDLVADDWEQAMEDLWLETGEVPLVVWLEVGSGLRLAGFLTALRALVEETAPGVVRWEGRERDGERYVRISSDQVVSGDEIALLYATPPGALVVSLQEEALLRAVARARARAAGDGDGDAADGGGAASGGSVEGGSVEGGSVEGGSMEGGAGEGGAGGDEDAGAAVEPWLGGSVALDVRAEGLELLRRWTGAAADERARLLSWKNLPVLNEWRRLHPDRDPLEVHEELWGERLECPGGGAYAWNAEWHTMESTVYGHPGEPGEGPGLPALVAGLRRARAGLTFEADGLRARIELERE